MGGKFANINWQNIDKNNLGGNKNLYSQTAEYITKDEFDKIKTFVLFGIDTQSAGDGQEQEGFVGRSDTIIIVSINPKYKSIKLISIPRDTYAEIENYGKTKINHGYAIGGPQLAVKTINMNFDLDISEYATIDFSGLADVINEIDGIEITITKEEKEYINAVSKLGYELSGNKYKVLNSYGKVILDGEQAVAYSRDRRNGDDFDRAERQRNVISAIFNKIAQMDSEAILNLADSLLKKVTTNINLANYFSILGELIANKNEYLNNIVSKQVPSKEYAEGKYIDGIYYFVPSDTDKMKEEMREYLFKR